MLAMLGIDVVGATSLPKKQRPHAVKDCVTQNMGTTTVHRLFKTAYAIKNACQARTSRGRKEAVRMETMRTNPKATPPLVLVQPRG